jgi:hypothetical protein
MGIAYEQDIVAWANEQASFIRAGRFDLLDLENIAEEIEDVGKSEKRELASRMTVLIIHLLKWQFQAARRGTSWQRTIKEQRKAIASEILDTPSLKTTLRDANWQQRVWSDSVAKAIEETGLDTFPDLNPWTFEEILSVDFFPEN